MAFFKLFEIMLKKKALVNFWIVFWKKKTHYVKKKKRLWTFELYFGKKKLTIEVIWAKHEEIRNFVSDAGVLKFSEFDSWIHILPLFRTNFTKAMSASRSIYHYRAKSMFVFFFWKIYYIKLQSSFNIWCKFLHRSVSEKSAKWPVENIRYGPAKKKKKLYWNTLMYPNMAAPLIQGPINIKRLSETKFWTGIHS